MRNPRPTKFVRGGVLRTLLDLMLIHRDPRRTHYVYWHGRPRHTAWMVNLSVAVIQNCIDYASLHEAVPNPEYKELEKHGHSPF